MKSIRLSLNQGGDFVSDIHIEDRLTKLEKQNKHLKLLIIFLIVIMALSLISIIFFIQTKNRIAQDSYFDDKDIQRLELSIKNNESRIAKLQVFSEDSQEYKKTIDTLNLEHDYLEGTIRQLIEPNLFSPWHIYDGSAGVWFINENGEGKWLPNTSLKEFTILLDGAIRDGFRKQVEHREGIIEILIYLDEEGPEEYITIDLNNNKIIYRNEQYPVAKDDIEELKTFLNEKGIDGNSR